MGTFGVNTKMSTSVGISRILSTASRVRTWTQPNSASFSQSCASLSPASKKQETLEEELARKKSAAYAKMDKKEEPMGLPFNAIFEDQVEELYKDLDKRRHAMSVANRAVSAFGNTPGLKWGPPIYDRFKLPS